MPPRPSHPAPLVAGSAFVPGRYRPYDTPVDGVADVLPTQAFEATQAQSADSAPVQAFEATEAQSVGSAPTQAFEATEAQTAASTPVSGTASAASTTTPAPVPGTGASLPSIPPPPTASDLPVAAGSSAAEVLEATVPDLLPPPPRVPATQTALP
ncbi:hypothetical protein GT354_13410, partial [Streptomyces sp. SID3343]|nr:hypothetical protein [Streptomyces sp. SID3343]